MNKTIPTLCVATLLSVSPLVYAAPMDEASVHFNAIATGDVDEVMQSYSNNAILQWVGGPLDGAYVGQDKIRETWGKFTKANAPLEVSVSKLEESANPKGSTVTANVEFKGKATIRVRYVLVYRDGKLVDEVWQIDPKLMTGYSGY